MDKMQFNRINGIFDIIGSLKICDDIRKKQMEILKPFVYIVTELNLLRAHGISFYMADFENSSRIS